MVRNLVRIFSEVLITLRSVQYRYSQSRISTAENYLVQMSSSPGGRVGGWVVGFETRDQLKLGLSRSIPKSESLVKLREIVPRVAGRLGL